MAILLPNSVFIHTPKTGGQWVTSALERAGLVRGKSGVVHATTDEIFTTSNLTENKMTFAFVRHPLSWYQSMWAHRMDEQWQPIDDTEWFSSNWIRIWADFTKYCQSNNFNEYIAKCVDHFPGGFLSSLFDAYTHSCDFVGKQEQLASDLITVLTLAGEDFELKQIKETPKKNIRGRQPKRRYQTIFTNESIDRIMKAENRLIRKFNYYDIPYELSTTYRLE